MIPALVGREELAPPEADGTMVANGSRARKMDSDVQATRPRVLVVDDDLGACQLLADGLEDQGFDPTWKTNAQEALETVETHDFDVVVTDLRMHGMSGTDLCRSIALGRSDLPVIVVTAFGSLDSAVDALRAGAYDFITKPFDVEAVAMALKRAVEHRALRLEVKQLRRAVRDMKRYGELLGSNPAMQELYAFVERVADSEATVLITGASGTGKELVACELHRRSRRRSGPFIAINCAAMPEALLESELFGHVRGAFTDARAHNPGLLAKASGGTLLLDEIGDMPLGIQPKLLRALQERKVRPVGGNDEVPIDVRILACTHRDLESLVEDGVFREDLYYRVNVISVAVPPLCARGNDVLLLAQHFIEQFSAQAAKTVQGLSPSAAERLLSYDWPGNVRELQNCIERAVALCRSELIDAADFPRRVREHKPREVVLSSGDQGEWLSLEEVEKRYVLEVMKAVQGNKSSAAQILGLSRKTLYRRLRAYGVFIGGGGD
jgi:two-component system response regulator HydG